MLVRCCFLNEHCHVLCSVCKCSTNYIRSDQIRSVAQSCPTLCNPMNYSTPGSLSITNSWSSLRLTSIESVMPSSHLILCRPLLLLPPIPPLDCKEIQPVHSEGDQPWDFFGRNDAKAETPVLWPPHGKS